MNLSPFEVFFNENRQFFTEGTDLFNKGGLFYSRRVGGTPIYAYDVEDQLQNGEEVIDNPLESQLLNALKVSGRNGNGLGIGVFNAFTNTMYATVRDPEGEEREVLTDPFTNYNVLVFDQALKNNSYVTLINTNVMRDGTTYDANVTGTEFRFADKKNTVSLEGQGAVSQKFGLSDKVETGHRWGLELDKISGQWNYGVEYSQISDTYDPNDLGFLFRNNEQSYSTYVSYNIYEPFWKLNRLWSSFSVWYFRLYKPDTFTDLGMNFDIGGATRKFHAGGLWTTWEPINTFDYFEPREAGRYYEYPKNYTVGGWMSTDYRKRFAFDLRGNYRTFDEEGRSKIFYGIEPRYRVSNRLSFILEFEQIIHKNDIGWVNTVDEDIIFGRRDRLTTINTFNTSFIFTENMALRLRMRHYWSQVDYNRYSLLAEDGSLQVTDYDGLDEDGVSLHNTNFNTFNVDLIYTWVFSPGSEISFVWKNFILTDQVELVDNYFTNIENTFDASQTNSFSIKILYFIDYLNLKKKKSAAH